MLYNVVWHTYTGARRATEWEPASTVCDGVQRRKNEHQTNSRETDRIGSDETREWKDKYERIHHIKTVCSLLLNLNDSKTEMRHKRMKWINGVRRAGSLLSNRTERKSETKRILVRHIHTQNSTDSSMKWNTNKDAWERNRSNELEVKIPTMR